MLFLSYMLNDLIALRILCIPRMYFCAYGRISSSVVLVALLMGFSGGSAGKESACNAGDSSSIPRSGRSRGEGIEYPLQYSRASRRDRLPTPVFLGFPGESDSKRICLQCGRPGFNPWVGKILLEEGMATHSSSLAWIIPMDRGAWQATVHGVAKSQT